MIGYVYILECANGQYYVGSTRNLGKRFFAHQEGNGANFTFKHLPVKLIYVEKYNRFGEAFRREKQLQGWSRKEKEALITGNYKVIHVLAQCRNETHFKFQDKNQNPE